MPQDDKPKRKRKDLSEAVAAVHKAAEKARERAEAEREAEERAQKRSKAREQAAERARKRAEAKKRQEQRKSGLGEVASTIQQAAEKSRRRTAAREQAAERARKRAEARKRLQQKRQPKGGVAGVISAAQRAAEKAKRQEKRRVSEHYQAVGVSQKVETTVDDAGLEERFSALDTKFEALYNVVSLGEINDDLEDIDSVLATLPVTLETLRSRGYAFKSFLEKKVSVLQEQWNDLQAQVLDEVDSRSEELLREVDKAATLLDQAQASSSGKGAQRLLDRCESVLGRVESKVDAAQRAIEGMYDTLDNNVTQSQRQIETIAWTLDQVDEASFRLYPAEAVVAACQAQLLERGDDEGPKGIFFLTDERVLFEQKEEVATKKVLFVATDKEMVQELRFDEAIGNVEEMKASDKGVIRHKELLELHFGGDAALRRVHLRLLGGADSQEWQGLIGRVVSGDIAQERVEPKDEAIVEAARSAPTECPNCGAQFTEPVVRGMQSITCEYCGFTVRL